LSMLPPEIGQLFSLKHLWISYNQLATLPSEIKNLTQLNSLDLTGNQFQTLPSEIKYLTKLEQLWIGKNPCSETNQKRELLKQQVGQWLPDCVVYFAR
jgi:Leucine-rich repeat (LRR) protein